MEYNYINYLLQTGDKTQNGRDANPLSIANLHTSPMKLQV